MPSIARSSSSRPDSGTTDCHHSREPFDCAFRSINQRRDISPSAKLVHAHLVTLHRTGRDATQTEIGEAVGLSRHQVWRAIGELVRAELVQTIRYGLGRPNGYILLGVNEDDLDGRASGSRPPGPGLPASRETSRAGTYQPKRNDRKRKRIGVDLRDDRRDYWATSDGSRIQVRT